MTTVIIPAYKADWCLADAMESIGNQTVRPNKILIGVDACPESAAKALELKAEYEKRSRKHHTIQTDVYYFPQHVGPYRIRNMLALIAQPGKLVFFDADDIMYDNFLEVMTEKLTPQSFITPLAKLVRIEEGNKEMRWNRAHGVISIYRQTFLQHGGFEGWACGADTEAQARFEAGGLRRYQTKDAVMLVRKHGQGLTMRKESDYKSPVRLTYKEEIKRRRKEPTRCGAIAIANCYRVETAEDIEQPQITNKQVTSGCCVLPLPEVVLGKPQAEELPTADPALPILERLVAVTERGFDKGQRRAYDAAVRYIRERGKRGG